MARNDKNRLIKGTLSRAHRQRVQRVVDEGPRGMWRLAKWARNRSGVYERGLTPTLRTRDGATTAETVEQKAAAFQHAFFPQPPEADMADTEGYIYPESVEFPEITPHEIEEAIQASPAGKAPGEDAIPNALWHKLIKIPVVASTLHQLFNAYVRTGYNPGHFQRSITVVLRKAGDRDYQEAKSYRPVALLNTIAKFLESIIARRISYAVEEHGLLPKGHLGGRRGISTEHAIQIMLDRIRTYDNVSHARLLHNLRKRRLGQLAPWIGAFLTGRSTRIRMPEGISERIPTPTGIPQGSPLSPILYLLYNADLLEDCQTRSGDLSTMGWVDDVGFMATGKMEKQTISKLEKACEKARIWARRHASVFDPKKYNLIHFVPPERRHEGQSFLLVEGQDGLHNIIFPEQAARYLGFWLDPQLTFSHHHEKAVIKGSTSIQALRSLAGSTWGASTLAMRRIYQAVVIPQMLYGVSAWYSPLTTGKGKAQVVSSKFAAIQKRAACLIGGAFKTSAAEALNIELYLPPIGIQMERISAETALRIRTGPAHGVPQLMIRQRSQQQRQRGGWSPMEAHAWQKGGCLTAPPDTLQGEWESRRAYVRAPWQAPPEVVILERDEAVKTHLEISKNQGKLLIYTDGSGIEGKVGAAAVVEATHEHRHCQMGTEQDSTVYSAELRAIEMATELVQEHTQHAVIFSDSQAALRALLRPRMPSGQVYLRGCLENLQKLADQGVKTELRWIPAHQGIPGNELVDEHAKQAAKAEADTPGPHDRRIKLAAAAKRDIQERAKITWEAAWEKEKKVGQVTKRLIPVPTKEVLDY
ncbi:reverse transcriptase [Penicillium frequentans]|nr:reverse transcriptase [Penicillium glabrum]